MSHKQKDIKIAVNKVLEMFYWLYQKDLKNGLSKDAILSASKQAVGKSAKKAKTFHQTAFNYGK